MFLVLSLIRLSFSLMGFSSWREFLWHQFFPHFESLLLLKLRRGFLRSEFSLQALATMTPQRDRRRRTMQSFLGGTTSTCGTSAPKTAPHPVTRNASHTPTPPRWTQSRTSTLDSSAPCSSANQVSGRQNEQELLLLAVCFL